MFVEPFVPYNQINELPLSLVAVHPSLQDAAW